MDPGLFIVGGLAGWLVSWAYSESGEQQPAKPCGCHQPCGCPSGLPRGAAAPMGVEHPKVQEALRTVLPDLSEDIQSVVASDPAAASSWRLMAARLPYLAEAVAMYFTMADPNTSQRPKIIIAGSLLYLVSPIDVIPDAIPVIGQLDDIGVLLGALSYVYDVMKPSHLEQAHAWLQSQGIDPKPIFAIGKDFTPDEVDAAAQVSQKVAELGGAPQAESPLPALPGPTAQPAAPFQSW